MSANTSEVLQNSICLVCLLLGHGWIRVGYLLLTNWELALTEWWKCVGGLCVFLWEAGKLGRWLKKKLFLPSYFISTGFAHGFQHTYQFWFLVWASWGGVGNQTQSCRVRSLSQSHQCKIRLLVPINSSRFLVCVHGALGSNAVSEQHPSIHLWSCKNWWDPSLEEFLNQCFPTRRKWTPSSFTCKGEMWVSPRS